MYFGNVVELKYNCVERFNKRTTISQNYAPHLDCATVKKRSF